MAVLFGVGRGECYRAFARIARRRGGGDDTDFNTRVLQALDSATTLQGLGEKVLACVSKREAEEGAKPPSEPQMFYGREMRDLLLPLLPLSPAGDFALAPVQH